METLRTQNRRQFLAPLTGAILLAGGCKGKHSRTVVQNEEQPETGPKMASSVKMGDAAATTQLLRGCYGLEGGSGRWTAGAFAVLLRPPLTAAQKGATLQFAFSIPDVLIQKLNAVTLTASSGGKKLASERYAKPGAYTFHADLAPELLAKEEITVEFALDKSLPAGSVDQRELGLVATSVGLESK